MPVNLDPGWQRKLADAISVLSAAADPIATVFRWAHNILGGQIRLDPENLAPAEANHKALDGAAAYTEGLAKLSRNYSEATRDWANITAKANNDTNEAAGNISGGRR